MTCRSAGAAAATALFLFALVVVGRGQDAAPDALADGWRALRAGNVVTAQRAFTRAAAQSPDDPGPHEGLAKLAERHKDSARAVGHYEAALERAPDAARLHIAVGKLLSDMRDHPRAVAHLKQATDLQPNDAATWFTYAQGLWRVEWFPQAAAAYQRAIALRSDDAWAHVGLGDTRLSMGMLEDAVAAYDAAIALDPDAYAAHCGRGAALSKQGAFDDAVASLRKAIGLRGDYAPAFYELGVALQHQREYEAAIRAYGRAVQLNGLDASSVKNIARCYARLGKRDLARNANDHAAKLQKAQSGLAKARAYIAAYPSKPDGFVGLGAVYRDLGQPDAAVDAYEQALERDANSIAAASGLADTYLAVGRLDEAAEAHRSLIALQPADIETRVMFGMLLRELEEDVESAAVLAKAYQMASAAVKERGRGDDWNVLAYALFAQSRYDDAEEAMLQAMRLNPVEPSYAGRLASIQAARKAAR